ncbi:hypothetical protein EVAR_6024_1 [Eumeta japonica]|uniref:Uncharacterized protein n=1 Tax=Eumeta variegata TaxID=151549 RepID=A0A4C1TD17_EUMVA|nr:hypothetical protein EVAR_6024_1 [Eumeta japonica]
MMEREKNDGGGSGSPEFLLSARKATVEVHNSCLYSVIMWCQVPVTPRPRKLKRTRRCEVSCGKNGSGYKEGEGGGAKKGGQTVVDDTKSTKYIDIQNVVTSTSLVAIEPGASLSLADTLNYCATVAQAVKSWRCCMRGSVRVELVFKYRHTSNRTGITAGAASSIDIEGLIFEPFTPTQCGSNRCRRLCNGNVQEQPLNVLCKVGISPIDRDRIPIPSGGKVRLSTTEPPPFLFTY